LRIDKNLKNNKIELLCYLRNRASESAELVKKSFSESEYKKRAKKINQYVQESAKKVEVQLIQLARNELWTNQELLDNLLLVRYCEYIVMLESRNQMWSYEYMSFARRIGEIWEPFCKIIYEYPINSLTLFTPPTFSEIKQLLTSEIENHINELSINIEKKNELKKYYKKVWSFVTSGEVKLELDLHFNFEHTNYNIDMKSSFNSNEKGNTNRLLLVGSIYKSLEENYQNLLFVRAKEIDNNHYLQTLKNSGIWEVYTGEDTYDKMYETTGFDIKSWINENINWQNDINSEFYTHLENHNLLGYLEW